MPILTRLRRLFRADVHAILDSMEDPESLLKQALREMEEALDQKRLHLSRQEQQVVRLETSCNRLEEKLTQVGKDVELALSDSSEEVCRKIIARKLTLQKQLAHMEQQQEEARSKFRALSKEIQQQQEEYQAVREQAEVLVVTPADDSPQSVARSILSASAGETRETSGFAASKEEIELEWLRLQQKQGGKS